MHGLAEIKAMNTKAAVAKLQSRARQLNAGVKKQPRVKRK